MGCIIKYGLLNIQERKRWTILLKQVKKYCLIIFMWMSVYCSASSGRAHLSLHICLYLYIQCATCAPFFLFLILNWHINLFFANFPCENMLIWWLQNTSCYLYNREIVKVIVKGFFDLSWGNCLTQLKSDEL